MKCQKCKQNEANTHLTKIVNGNKTEIYLCEECAEKSQDFLCFKTKFDHEIDNFFSGFLGNYHIGKGAVQSVSSTKCETCGTTLERLQKIGRPGCSDCYRTFSEFLLRPLKQIHGTNKHTGKIPLRAGAGMRMASEIDKLQSDLNRAVMEQNFERAAELRDKINELKKSKEA